MIRAFKLTGAGNHFLLIDLCDKKAAQDFTQYIKQKYFRTKHPLTGRSRMAKDLCNPFQSLGADGLLFLENSSSADVKWDFYNADGSRAEMCGNAARCVGAYFAFYSPHHPNPIRVETLAGEILVTLLPSRGLKTSVGEKFVCVEMPRITFGIKNHKQKKHLSTSKKGSVKVGKLKINFDVIDSGVPHAVFDVSNIKFSFEKDLVLYKIKNRNRLSTMIEHADQLNQIVNKTRQLSQFKKTGTNVTFYVRGRSHHLESFTFERGVAGYTQACGTGALAAAYCFSKGKYNFVTVKVPGGKLAIDFAGERPLLLGPAKMIAEINLI